MKTTPAEVRIRAEEPDDLPAIRRLSANGAIRSRQVQVPGALPGTVAPKTVFFTGGEK